MTRESKLALVLGFSLMLFVLILVSDHMAARNAPVVATNTTVRNDLGVPPLPGPGAQSGFVLTGANGAKALPDTKPEFAEPVAQGDQSAQPQGAGQASGSGDIVIGRPHDSKVANGAGQPSHGDLPVPQSVKTYTVKKGDTFAAIAAAEYKKRSLGDKLAAFNGMKPGKLKIGDTIKLPTVEELDPSTAPSHLAAADESSKPASSTDRPSDKVASSEPSFRTYKVKEGDTLYRIAEREMGTANRWKELRSANSEVLKGGSDLQPGMQIKIPEQRLTSASTDA